MLVLIIFMEEVAALVIKGIMHDWNVFVMCVFWLYLARGLSVDGVMSEFWVVSVG